MVVNASAKRASGDAIELLSVATNSQQPCADPLEGLLTELKLGHLAPQFRSQEIDVSIIAGLSDAELEKLGVSTIGARHRLRDRAAEQVQSRGSRPLRRSIDQVKWKEGFHCRLLPCLKGKMTPLHQALAIRFRQLDENNSGALSVSEIRLHGDEIEAVVTSIREFFTSTGVVAALLLGITAPTIMQASLNSPSFYAAAECTNSTLADESREPLFCQLSEENKMVLATVFVQALWIASVASLITVMACLQFYIFLTVAMIDLEDKLWFLSEMPIQMPRFMLAFALLSTLVGLIAGIILVHTPRLGIGCIISGSSMIFTTLIYLKLTGVSKIRARLERKLITGN
jgi:hypothetical protein